MEEIYQEVEMAIKNKLHLAFSVSPSQSWGYPVEIKVGNIIMRDSDSGAVRPTWEITTACWAENEAKFGLWKKIGLWLFIPADDPAANDIRFAELNPTAAGREIYRLKNRKVCQ